MASVIKKMADTLRNIDICIVLQQAGALRDQADTKKWHTTQGIISITGQKFFNWNRYCGGGGAIDMAMHLMQTDFKTELYWLKNNCSNRVLSNHTAKKTLRLPKPYPNNLPKVYPKKMRCDSDYQNNVPLIEPLNEVRSSPPKICGGQGTCF